MTKSTFTKRKAQMKSSNYYLFWGIATIAVVAGQIYVGSGYRNMSKSIDGLIKTYINRPRTAPADLDRQSSQTPYQMPIIR